MLTSTLNLTPTWLLPARSGLPAHVACTLFESEEHTLLFIEAPNWANAVNWSTRAALAAWERWRDSPERLNAWNPCDSEHFAIYRVRPGYPLGGIPLWQEPFSYYLPLPRAASLIQRLVPEPGTSRVTEQKPEQSLSDLFEARSWSPRRLQHFDFNGQLQPLPAAA